MSASEQLRALDDFRFDLDPDEGWNAIVAVVEAAERAERKAMVHGGNGTLVDIARSLHPALTALEEALS